MKTLYLIRHAKSDWDNKNIDDIDRPLNARGYSDAHKMSQELKEKNIFPDLIITSPAIRAISTALIFGANLEFDPSQFIIDSKLYDTSAKQYISIISKIEDQYKNIMLFGHNPLITDCANRLTPAFTGEMSTCCVVGIKGSVGNWSLFSENMNELVYYSSPKSAG